MGVNINEQRACGMSTETIVLIVGATLLFDLVFFLFIFRMRRKKKEQIVRLAVEVEKKGWRISSGRGKGEALRFTGETSSGSPWEMTITQERGKRGTIWRAPALELRDDVLAIGPFTGMSQITGEDELDLGHRLIQTALGRLYGEEAAADLARARIVHLPEELQGPWVAFSSNQELAEHFLADPVASVLREWRDESSPAPSILFWRGGLELRFRNGVSDPDVLDQIVTLGDILALRGEELVGGHG